MGEMNTPMLSVKNSVSISAINHLAVLSGYTGRKDKIMSVINLDEINDTQGIIDAFDKLNERAIALGTPICLNTETSTSLVLYFHDDYENRILVDKYLSNLKRKCPRCGSLLAPSDVEGYAYVCHECDENFCHFEVDETEEWHGSNVMMVSD